MRALTAIHAPLLAHQIFELLASVGAVVDQTSNGEGTVNLARQHDYDIIFLDAQLPDIEGGEVLRRLRSAGIEIPVIMLSHLRRPLEKCQAFALGADEVVTIPFDEAELLARGHAVIRRAKGLSQSARLEVGPLTLRLDSQEVLVHGRPLHLTAKEYAVVELMMQRKGIALSKDAVLDHLYGGRDEPEPKIIDVFISKIRRKLAAAGADGMVSTVWGRGYLLREPEPKAEQAHENRPLPRGQTAPERAVYAGA